MKKILLVISVVSVLFLAGCGVNHDNDTDNIIDNRETQIQTSGESIGNDSKPNSDTEKYKLSDDYYISGEKLNETNSLMHFGWEDSGDRFEAHNLIESDGIQFDITCEERESTGEEKTDVHYYYVKVNGELIEFNDRQCIGCGSFGNMWVVDLDKTDQYKEIVIEESEGVDSYIYIYRLSKDGLKVLFSKYVYEDDLIMVNDKLILTNYLNSLDKKITIGYYAYDDGEFKYIDRLATGEKIKDEEGMLPNDFQKQEFGLCIAYDGKTGIDGTFNLVKYDNNINKDEYGIYYRQPKYTVRLVNDIVYYKNDGTTEVILPAGTVLENVEDGYQG